MVASYALPPYPEGVGGEIIYCAVYGNLISNIPASLLEGRDLDEVRIRGRSIRRLWPHSSTPPLARHGLTLLL